MTDPVEQPVRGHILSVKTILLGDVLAADATAAATSIFLEDSFELDESGGRLMLDQTSAEEEIVTYTAVNDDTGEVTLSAGLAFSHEAGTPATLYPEIIERRATIALDHADTNDDVVDARVPHSLYLLLDEGVRE
jgi:hypothetical protein